MWVVGWAIAPVRAHRTRRDPSGGRMVREDVPAPHHPNEVIP
jgi:hypothetical protein